MKRTTQLCLENTATNKQYVEMLKDLLKYGKLNTNSPPLRVKDIEAITKDLKNPIKVYTETEYEQLAEKNAEPKEAVIFYLPEGASSGHFIGVFTDEQNRIHYGDSFGKMNPVFIHPKNRTVIPVKNAVQNVKTSNCGWLAMLYALTHNKTKPIDRNHSN